VEFIVSSFENWPNYIKIGAELIWTKKASLFLNMGTNDMVWPAEGIKNVASLDAILISMPTYNVYGIYNGNH
jgi:hypothetical protein